MTAVAQQRWQFHDDGSGSTMMAAEIGWQLFLK
jgi:hypothetical protein